MAVKDEFDRTVSFIKGMLEPRDHELKVPVSASKYRKAKIITEYRGYSADRGFLRTQLEKAIDREWKEVCEEIAEEKRITQALACPPHGPSRGVLKRA